MRTKRKPAFPGGVHPTDGFDKALSMDAVTKPYWPDTVTILSEQSFGREVPISGQAGRFRYKRTAYRKTRSIYGCPPSCQRERNCP